jgi:hypothetical protein
VDFLHQEIMFGFTLREIVIALVVIWILSGVVKKMFGGDKVSRKLLKKKCRGCNWVGPAGPTTKRCPKCRGPLITAE